MGSNPPPTDHPLFGSTRTTTILTTITAQPKDYSVTIQYPWPARTSPLSYATVFYTTSNVPNIPASTPGLENVYPVITQTLVLPILVLTVVDALIVNPDGKTLNRGALTQPPPSFTGVRSTLGGITLPTPTSLIIPAFAPCGGFHCWTKPQRIGMLVGVSIVGSAILYLMIGLLCCSSYNTPRKTFHFQVQPKTSPSPEDDVELGPYYPYGRGVLSNSPPRPTSVCRTAAESSSEEHSTLAGRFAGLLLWKKDCASQQKGDRPGLRSTVALNGNFRAPDESSVKATKSIAVGTRDFAYKESSKQLNVTGIPNSPSADNFSCRVDSPENADRATKGHDVEIAAASKQALAQSKYHQGHKHRPKGENRRRERSADYERRGDRLRKESPEAKAQAKAEEKEEILTSDAHRSRLRAKRASSAVPMEKIREMDLNYNSPTNVATLGRALIEEERGRKRSKEETPSTGRYRSGKKKGHLADGIGGKTVSEYKLEFGIESSDDENVTERQNKCKGREEEVFVESKDKGKGRAKSISPPPLPRRSSQRPRFEEPESTHRDIQPESGSDEYKFESDEDSRGRILKQAKEKSAEKENQSAPHGKNSKRSKLPSGDFGRYGERKGHGSSGSEKRRSWLPSRRSSPEKRKPSRNPSPEKRRSRGWDLLPLALQAMETLAEPKGGWNQQTKKGGSEIERDRAYRIQRRERRLAERRFDSAGEPIQPAPAKIPKQAAQRIDLLNLDRTLEKFRTQHSPIAMQASRERLRAKWAAQEQKSNESLKSNNDERINREMREHDDALRATGYMEQPQRCREARSAFNRSGRDQSASNSYSKTSPNVNTNNETPSKIPKPNKHYPDHQATPPTPTHAPNTRRNVTFSHQENIIPAASMFAPTPKRALSRKHVRIIGEGRNHQNPELDGANEPTASNAGTDNLPRRRPADRGHKATADNTQAEGKWDELRDRLV